MSDYKGFLFSKLEAIGSKSEGPVYYIQQLDYIEIKILKKANPWEQDPALQKYLGSKVDISGQLESGGLKYEKIGPYTQPKSRMAGSIALKATINKKEVPYGIYVSGSIIVFTDETEVSVTKSESQGFNPAVLLLDVIVTEKPGAMKGIPHLFFYEEHGDAVGKYTHVHVKSSKGDHATVEIDVLN